MPEELNLDEFLDQLVEAVEADTKPSKKIRKLRGIILEGYRTAKAAKQIK